jgi:hypothetical protein
MIMGSGGRASGISVKAEDEQNMNKKSDKRYE